MEEVQTETAVMRLTSDTHTHTVSKATNATGQNKNVTKLDTDMTSNKTSFQSATPLSRDPLPPPRAGWDLQMINSTTHRQVS